MITVMAYSSSNKRLKSCGWKYTHNNVFDRKVFLKEVNEIELTATLYDDGVIEVFVDCNFPTPDDFIAIGEELKKLEE